MPSDVEDTTEDTTGYPDESTGEYTEEPDTTTLSTTTLLSTSTSPTSTTVTTTTPITTTTPAATTTTPAATTTKVVVTTTTVATSTSEAPVSTSSTAASTAEATTTTVATSSAASTSATVVDPVDPVEPTEPPLRPIVIDGEFETAFEWEPELADKESEQYKAKRDTLENDLQDILGADDDIESVELTECTFTEADADVEAVGNDVEEPTVPAVEDIIAADPAQRRKRQADDLANRAHADFKVKVTAKNREVAQAAATKTITEADPETFPSLSVNSAKTYSQVVTYADPIAVTVPATATASSEKLRIAISIMGVLAVLIL